MNNELRPYSEMKDSHQDWLGVVPSHWRLVKAKRLFRETSIKNHPNEELLSATQNKGVIPRRFLKTRIVMPMGNFETFKLVNEGNFVISLRSFQGGIEYSKYRGIVSPAYNVLEERMGQNRMYYKHLMKSKVFISELQRNVTGIRQGKNIDVNDFKEIIIPLPPCPEQDQIVKYLDHKLAKINKFIKAKKKLITVLKEQKQVIINEAVTKGLDSNVRMKPSGIEWLGDIQEHWEISAVKNFAKSNQCTLSETTNGDELIRYLEIGSVGFGELKEEPVTYAFKNAPSRARRIVSCGDIIISTVRTYLKSMVYIDESIQDCIVSTGFCVLTPGNKIYPRLLSYILTSNYFVGMVSQNSTGISYPAINETKLMSLRIAVPDTIVEQKRILDHIIEHAIDIDKKIDLAEREIELLKEYKNSLISDVVTGKVDIRHIPINKTEELDLGEPELEEELTEEEMLDTEEGDD